MKPNGKLVTQTLAMPKDTNANGDIFGGWVLSQMDIGGAIQAHEVAEGRTATVAINGMSFLHPIKVGDLVSCYASVVKIGNTSITIRVETWTYSQLTKEQKKVTEGIYTYVAIDDNGRPRVIPKSS